MNEVPLSRRERLLRRLRTPGGARHLGKRAYDVASNWVLNRVPVDRRITYPCYKSMDELIDVERLKALDAHVLEGIERFVATGVDNFFTTGPRVLGNGPKVTGVRTISLTQKTKDGGYAVINQADAWEPGRAANLFPDLMSFIRTLPFKSTARMLIIFDASGKHVPAHRDMAEPNMCHEFIWMRTNLRKPFFMLNAATNERRYVESYSAWFDTCNQAHGADATDSMSVSIRVDGMFTDELRSRIPRPTHNRASTAALWACMDAKR